MSESWFFLFSLLMTIVLYDLVVCGLFKSQRTLRSIAIRTTLICVGFVTGWTVMGFVRGLVGW